jgi:hypothetical protein
LRKYRTAQKQTTLSCKPRCTPRFMPWTAPVSSVPRKGSSTTVILFVTTWQGQHAFKIITIAKVGPIQTAAVVGAIVGEPSNRGPHTSSSTTFSTTTTITTRLLLLGVTAIANSRMPPFPAASRSWNASKKRRCSIRLYCRFWATWQPSALICFCRRPISNASW